ncbi:Serine/threonine-protein kinase Pkn1 [Enhygromyxa salina]|uniref:Serine/threonine-protein kinase Pkn1 n=1 Tax=Enhygromyxa salina TaxID=215803 RepID=A0A2S9XRC1_9BACT|nr:serine/threonine-protein kinase [Enhygromyxa salina]PRP95413.1 Serine/threonine-protein kinase Pkn1 [Enhygromyxa salina]
MGEANDDVPSAEVIAATMHLKSGADDGVGRMRVDRQLSHMWADDPDEPEQPQLALGEIVDERYRIESLLGAGGMGTVYKATQLDTGATVALKLMLPKLAAELSARRRFEREAQAILRMDHENCVKILDYGERPPHTPYLVMEFLDGAVLRSVMDADEPLTSARALEILRGVLRGLGHAHARGVIHRDIKPENVFMVDQPDGPAVPKLLDLGLAKLVSTDDTSTPYKLTMRGAVFGTPAYMAPEQALGEEVDGRADLYAATVMLYEMLTGRRPFYSHDAPALLIMHTRRPPPSLADHASFLADYEGLQELVSQGLAKRPMLRFADAEAYIEALEPVLAALEKVPTGGGLPGPCEGGDAGAEAEAEAEADSPTTLPGVRPRPPSSLRGPLIVALLLGLGLVLGWWLAGC